MYGECKQTWQVLIKNTRNYDANRANKHKRMCQKLCQKELGERVYLDQRTTMCAGLNHESHDHEKAAK